MDLSLTASSLIGGYIVYYLACTYDSPENYNYHVLAGALTAFGLYSYGVRVPVVSNLTDAVLPR